jgi:hypothetical protein
MEKQGLVSMQERLSDDFFDYARIMRESILKLSFIKHKDVSTYPCIH